MGRPEKPIDWKLVDDMILKGETEKMICQRFDIDVTNFIDRFKAEHNTNFTNYSQSKKAEGLRLLRSVTFNRAIQGNDKCLMHLNRHMRGEWDKIPQEIDVPNEMQLDQSHENMLLKARIAELEAKFANQS